MGGVFRVPKSRPISHSQIVGEWDAAAIGGDAARSFLSFNDWGAALENSAGWRSECTLADALVDAYDADRARAAADAETFVSQLVARGIAEIA